jgi:hypothetical protein
MIGAEIFQRWFVPAPSGRFLNRILMVPLGLRNLVDTFEFRDERYNWKNSSSLRIRNGILPLNQGLSNGLSSKVGIGSTTI